MSKNFQPLSSGEVLSVSNESQFVIGHSTFRVSEFTTALKQLMLEHSIGGITPETIDWLNGEGIECDVLRFGSTGWVKGKVRLHLEFAEDESEGASPDPKSEAVTDSLASVAAIKTSEISSTVDEDLGLDDFDLGVSEEIAASSADLTETLQVNDFNFDSEETTESPELTLDLEDEFGFGDADLDFGDDAPAVIDDSVNLSKSTIISKETFVQTDSSFDDLFGEEELVEETATTSDDDFGDFFDDEVDEISSTEAVSAESFELDVLGDPFAEEAESASEFSSTAEMDDSLDDLFEEEGAEDGGAELFEDEVSEEEPATTTDELNDFDLGFDEDSHDFDLEELSADDSTLGDTEAIASISESESITAEDFDLEEFSGATSTAIDDEETLESLMEPEVSETESDDMSFDDLLEEEFTEAEDPFGAVAEVVESRATDTTTSDDLFAEFAEDELMETEDETDQFSFDEDTDESAAVMEGEFDADFSFDEAGMIAETKADSRLDDLFDEDEASSADDFVLGEEDESPSNLDFGSTADLGEFINVAMIKKKSPVSTSPSLVVKEADLSADDSFDLGDDEFADLVMDDSPIQEEAESSFGLADDDDDALNETESPFGLADDDAFNETESPFGLTDDDDVVNETESSFGLADDDAFDNLDMDANPFGDDDDADIGLGELLDDGDDDFDFDALGTDPLDAVTGEEEVVSADIWDLE